MKNSWIIQVEQLLEWRKLILKGKTKDVVEQIGDILNQIGYNRFNEVKTTFLLVNNMGEAIYAVDAWQTDCQDEEGSTLANIKLFKNGRFEVNIRDEYEYDQEVHELVYGKLEELLKERLIGKAILVPHTKDDDLYDWLEENKTEPLIVESLEIDSWGIWTKNCPYRIDLDEYILE